MPDPDDLVEWVMNIVLALFVFGLLVVLGWAVVDAFQDSSAKDRCGELGGKVEFYDGAHPKLWRCVGAQPEAR